MLVLTLPHGISVEIANMDNLAAIFCNAIKGLKFVINIAHAGKGRHSFIS